MNATAFAHHLALKLVYPLPMAQADTSVRPPIPAHVRQAQVNEWHRKTVERMRATIEAELPHYSLNAQS